MEAQIAVPPEGSAASALENFSEQGDGRTPFGVPVRLQIVQEEGQPDYFLFRFDEDGAFAGDTFHESLEEALEQAEIAFGVTRSDWIRVQG